MESIIICGVDPGKLTGVALLTFNGNLSERELLHYTEVPFDEVPKYFEGMIGGVDVFAIERYIITARTVSLSRQYEALYVIGGIIFLADLAGVPYLLQSSADAKNAYGTSAVEGFDIQAKHGHARDALRHALLATHKRSLYSEVKSETKT